MAPAPMKAYLPILLPQTMAALAPIVAPFLTNVGLNSCFRETKLRGFIPVGKTQEGPQKTSSSSVTPSKTETLFSIFTLLPILAPLPMKTFCPITQLSPIVVSGIMCEKCQILVPFPIRHGSSTMLVSWTKKSCMALLREITLPLFSSDFWQRESTCNTCRPLCPFTLGPVRVCTQ